MIRFNPQERFFLANDPLFDHIDSDAHRGEAGPLAGAGLQHPKFVILNGELNVLHILIMFLENSADLL